MDKVKVTPEMQERILRSIQAAELSPSRPKILPFTTLKRYLSAVACLTLLIAGAIALPRLLDFGQPNPPDVLLPPMIEEAASLQELSELVGFEVEVGFHLPFEPEDTSYCAFEGSLAEVSYTGGSQSAVFRQSVGAEDNSGDFNHYTDTVQVDANGRTITLRGDGGIYVLAIWTDKGFSCSLRLTPGAAEEEWLSLLAAY